MNSGSKRRIALGIEYDGSGYFGWQIQVQQERTIQGQLEQALSFIANEPVRTFCAGRTDTGVHAVNQVVHFDTQAERDIKAWVLGTNTRLPSDIRVRWAKEVSEDFHARFSATARRYRYVIDNRSVKPALLGRQLSWNHKPLNAELMHQAGQVLVGTHDFTSFRTVHCQAHSPVRILEHLRVERLGNLVVIDVRANGFLHHMVRNIAGVLMTIGAGEQSANWCKEVLGWRDRTLGGVTAPPEGLFFMEVTYPQHFDLPKAEPGLPFLL